MIILIILTLLIGSMFWQPSFSGIRMPEEPSKKERYITRVNDLLMYRRYDVVLDMLSHPEYPKEELPYGQWMKKIASDKEKVTGEVKQMDDLEVILNS